MGDGTTCHYCGKSQNRCECPPEPWEIEMVERLEEQAQELFREQMAGLSLTPLTPLPDTGTLPKDEPENPFEGRDP